MSIESDIVGAIAAGVASIGSGSTQRFFPNAAEQDTGLPLVIYRRIGYEPMALLNGYAGLTKSVFAFECWAASKAQALATADEVVAAIDGYAGFPNGCTREPPPDEQYEPSSDEFVEVVAFSFWHA